MSELEHSEPQCPRCASTNWTCWDERMEWYRYEDGEYVELPVGYLKCKDCGAGFTSHAVSTDEAEHVGTYEEAFGDDSYHLQIEQ